MSSKCSATNCHSGWKLLGNDIKIQCALCDLSFHVKCIGMDEKLANFFASMIEAHKCVKYHCEKCLNIIDVVNSVTEKLQISISKQVDDINMRMLEFPKQMKSIISEQLKKDDMIGKVGELTEKMEPWNTVVSKKKRKAPSVVMMTMSSDLKMRTPKETNYAKH